MLLRECCCVNKGIKWCIKWCNSLSATDKAYEVLNLIQALIITSLDS